MWHPAPPVHAGPVPARPNRWVVGELRFALGLAVVGAVVALGSIRFGWAGMLNFGSASASGRSSTVFGLPPAACGAAGVAAAFGVVIGVLVAMRARTRCRPDGWRDLSVELPRTAPDQVRHTLPSRLWPLAVLMLIASAWPLTRGLVGMVDGAAIPVILVLLSVVRRSESRTGVAVHQLQIRSVFVL